MGHLDARLFRFPGISASALVRAFLETLVQTALGEA
jgi:hypothetical protein